MIYRVSEPTFWRNYFYRVTIVKQTVLSQPPTDQPKIRQNDDILFDFKDEEDEDVITKEEEDEDVVTKEEEESIVIIEKKLVITTDKKEEDYEGMEEWEIELRKAAI